MKQITLKKFVDTKGISLVSLAEATGLGYEVIENMYNHGVFNGDELGVNALTSLMQELDIINVNDLIPSIK